MASTIEIIAALNTDIANDTLYIVKLNLIAALQDTGQAVKLLIGNVESNLSTGAIAELRDRMATYLISELPAELRPS